MNLDLAKPGRARWYALAAIALTVAVYAGVVLWGRHQLRVEMRAQILGRDAEILHALTLHVQTGADGQGLGDLADPEVQYQVLLEIAGLTNIVAARLFTADGAFVRAVPAAVRETRLDPAAMPRLRALAPFSLFRSRLPVATVFTDQVPASAAGGAELSWVEVNVPLHAPTGGALLGVAQFLLNGQTAEREFALLDRRLNRQSALVLAAGAALATLGLGWAFRRLERAGRLLAARSEELQKANFELSQTAKAAALGAVTAHLMHSLKNPVAGLESFVAAQPAGDGPGPADEWREALLATRRVQALIQQTLEVLREQQEEDAYELTLAEIAGQVAAQALPAATARRVRIDHSCVGTAVLDNRVAGILRLILANLLQNAIDASHAGGRAQLELRAEPNAVVCVVRDDGPGVPEGLRGRLFEPVRSTKEGGSGIGLAISRRLALHLGAELTLVSTSSNGSVFRVRLPRSG